MGHPGARAMREDKTRARSLWPKQQRGDGSRIPDLDPQLLRADNCHLIRPVFGFLAHPAGFRDPNIEASLQVLDATAWRIKAPEIKLRKLSTGCGTEQARAATGRGC